MLFSCPGSHYIVLRALYLRLGVLVPFTCPDSDNMRSLSADQSVTATRPHTSSMATPHGFFIHKPTESANYNLSFWTEPIKTTAVSSTLITDFISQWMYIGALANGHSFR